MFVNMNYKGIELHEGNFIETVVCYLVKGDEALLGLRKRVSTGLGENLYAGIGGKLELDETYDKALLRETDEEIRVEIVSYFFAAVIEFFYQDDPKRNMRTIAYIVNDWKSIPQETESTKPEWFKQSDIPKINMFSDNKYWLPRILKGEQLYCQFVFNKYSGDDKKIVDMQFNKLI